MRAMRRALALRRAAATAAAVTLGLGTLSGAGVLAEGDAAAAAAKTGNARGSVPEGFSAGQYPANNPIEDRYAAMRYAGRDAAPVHLAAVFDGHGGWQVAEFAERHLLPMLRGREVQCSDAGQLQTALVQTFLDVDGMLRERVRKAYKMGFGQVASTGACALVALRRENELFVANSGDCRAVLGRVRGAGGDSLASSLSVRNVLSWAGFSPKQEKATTPSSGSSKWAAVALSRDHNSKLPAEQEALRRAHPGEEDIVVCKRPDSCYVKGRLQPTRSLGDFYLKSDEFNGPPYDDDYGRTRGRHVPSPFTPPYVLTEPEILQHTVSANDKFIVLGSDGVWDFLSNEEVVDVVGKAIDDGQGHLAAQRVVQRVLETAALEAKMGLDTMLAIPKGSRRRQLHDDTTVLVMML